VRTTRLVYVALGGPSLINGRLVPYVGCNLQPSQFHAATLNRLRSNSMSSTCYTTSPKQIEPTECEHCRVPLSLVRNFGRKLYEYWTALLLGLWQSKLEAIQRRSGNMSRVTLNF